MPPLPRPKPLWLSDWPHSGLVLPRWAPWAWWLPEKCTDPSYAMYYIAKTDSMGKPIGHWHLPNGRLYVIWEGPPGLSRVVHLQLTWKGRYPG